MDWPIEHFVDSATWSSVQRVEAQDLRERPFTASNLELE
jgi:hypothetical protein